MEKLLAKGEGWLAGHPEKEEITRRYLKFQPSLYRQALARLVQEEQPVEAEEDERPERSGRGGAGEAAQPQRAAARGGPGGAAGERGQAGARPRLRRGQAAPGAAQGQAVRGDRRHGRVDPHPGRRPATGSSWTGCPSGRRPGIKLIHGSLMYRDRRLEGFDAAAVVEVVEHLDPPRLSAFERVRLRVRPAGDGRADDAEPGVQRDVGERRGRASSATPTTASSGPGRSSGTGPRGSPGGIGYAVRFLPVGPVDEALGPPTQMGVFERD